MFKIDGEIGNKRAYDPRAYLKKGEEAMATRVGKACDDLLSVDKTIVKDV
jgi:fructose-bisphosphate aldolase class II